MQNRVNFCLIAIPLITEPLCHIGIQTDGDDLLRILKWRTTTTLRLGKLSSTGSTFADVMNAVSAQFSNDLGRANQSLSDRVEEVARLVENLRVGKKTY